MLARNLIANYFGQIWVALMGFLFVPIYVGHLGLESYGVIGMFGAFIAWLALLDAGLKPALGREMARFTGGATAVQATWDLLRSVEFVCVAIAVVIGGTALASADWIATSWVKADKISAHTIAKSFTYIGSIAALRFVEGVYSSCLSGLQRHVLMNAVSAVLATVRSVGAVAVLLYIEASINAFFVWQLAMSALSVMIYWQLAYQVMPLPLQQPRFSWVAIKHSWHFAGGMLMITLLALLLTQVDKVLLSTLIPLEDYGRYTLASVAAAAIFTLISPISVTFLPRLTQLHASGDVQQFAKTFHRGAQLVTILGGSVTIVAIFNAQALLYVWLRDIDLARQTYLLFALLLGGNFLNGLCHMPYQAQLAQGITRFALRVNAMAAAILVPLIFIVVPSYGVIGAAVIWSALNFFYVLVIVVFVFSFILQGERMVWLLGDVLRPLLPSVVVAAVGCWLMPEDLGIFITLASLALLTVFSCLFSLLACSDLRNSLLRRFQTKLESL